MPTQGKDEAASTREEEWIPFVKWLRHLLTFWRDISAEELLGPDFCTASQREASYFSNHPVIYQLEEPGDSLWRNMYEQVVFQNRCVAEKKNLWSLNKQPFQDVPSLSTDGDTSSKFLQVGQRTFWRAVPYVYFSKLWLWFPWWRQFFWLLFHRPRDRLPLCLPQKPPTPHQWLLHLDWGQFPLWPRWQHHFEPLSYQCYVQGKLS